MSPVPAPTPVDPDGGGSVAADEVLRVYNNAGTQHVAHGFNKFVTLFDTIADTGGGWDPDQSGGGFLTVDFTTHVFTAHGAGVITAALNCDFTAIAAGWAIAGFKPVGRDDSTKGNAEIDLSLDKGGYTGLAGQLFAEFAVVDGYQFRPIFAIQGDTGSAGADLTYFDLELRRIAATT